VNLFHFLIIELSTQSIDFIILITLLVMNLKFKVHQQFSSTNLSLIQLLCCCEVSQILMIHKNLYKFFHVCKIRFLFLQCFYYCKKFFIMNLISFLEFQ